MLRRLLPVTFFLLAAVPVAAQPGAGEVALGVTWTPPDSLDLALRDLRAMHQVGVTAVRTPLVEREEVLRLADQLGLALYQDLPVADLPAERLRDTLRFADEELQRALLRARGHPSARAFGLAQGADTSDPRACAYFEQLAEQAREARPDALLNYTTRFTESDVCAEAVDLVLLDARAHDPVRLLQRWRAAHEGAPAGIGGFGPAVSDGVEGGYRTPRSPMAQARTLEDDIGGLLRLDPPPPALFVRAWRDPTYGLLRSGYDARPALAVVRGFYTGRQRVFAIDAGPEPAARPGAPTFVLFGWLAVLLLGGAAFFAPRFRQLIPRYFTRHPYYREQLQRGRATETWATSVLMGVLCIAAGVVAAVVLYALAQTDVLEVLTAVLGEGGQRRFVALIERPWAVTLLVGGIYAVWLVLNMLWMVALAWKGYRIRPGQALVLVVWSRWAVLVLAVAALYLTTLPDGGVRWIPWLLALWVLAEVWAGVRELYDFARITRVPRVRALLLGIGAPLGVAAALVAVGLALARPELTFLWNLATKT
ncbi:MAG: hypothetical protein R3362_03920 [Rhodothermales bacterium]|nr:hypothetical protein [Rhodothermales bacterium]